MDRKHNRMTEGNVYFFTLPQNQDKANVSEAVNNALLKHRCGRVVGSGISLFNDSSVTIEIVTSDRHTANEAIVRACRKLECRDFDIVWD